MKKVLKILTVNIIILLICLIASEFIIFTIARNEHNKVLKDLPLKYILKLDNDNTWRGNFRNPEGLDSNKKPILLFGCSYTFGDGLKENQTFSHKLYEQTQRPVYNRAIGGTGIQHMYRQFIDTSFYNDIKSEPEYIIYVLLPSFHNYRLYAYTFVLSCNYLYLRYYPNKLDKDGNLIEQKPFLPPYFNGLYTVRYLEYLKALNKMNNGKKTEDFFFLIFKKSLEQVKIHYPNSKFVIFFFDNYKNESKDWTSLIEKLKNNGFIIVEMSEIADIDYNKEGDKYHISKSDCHPNEYFWDVITPKFVEKLGINN